MEDEEKGGPDAALASMRKERDAARRELRTAKTEIERLTPFETQAADLATQLATATGSLDALKGEHAIDLKLARKGFDDAGALVAKALHKAAGDDAPAFGEWLDSLEGDAIPKPLVPYLSSSEPAPAPADPAPEPVAQAEQPRDPAPRPGKVADNVAPTASNVTAEALRAARQHAEQTGDWSKVRELVRASRSQGF